MSDVVLKNVVKRYKDTDVLSGIDMTIKDGEFVTLLGPSGCGKTTIAQLLLRLYDPTGGKILIGTISIAVFDCMVNSSL